MLVELPLDFLQYPWQQDNWSEQVKKTARLYSNSGFVNFLLIKWEI